MQFFSGILTGNFRSLQWCLGNVKKDSSLMPALLVFLPDIISIITIRIYCTVTVKDIKPDAIELWLYTTCKKSCKKSSTTDPMQ